MNMKTSVQVCPRGPVLLLLPSELQQPKTSSAAATTPWMENGARRARRVVSASPDGAEHDWQIEAHASK